MNLSNKNSNTLMLALHKKIEEYANYYSEKLEKGGTNDLLTYPPNCGFSDTEIKALQKLKNDKELKSALRKILADNSAGVIFDLLNFLDGTANPDDNLGEWTEVALVDKTDEIESNNEMLHDNFLSTYWDWKEIRPNMGWTLDTQE